MSGPRPWLGSTPGKKRQGVVGPDRPGEFAAQVVGRPGDDLDALSEPGNVQGHGEAEGDRHGVLAMRSAHLRRIGVLAGQADQLAQQTFQIGQQHLPRDLDQAQGPGRVHDVGRGGEEMHEGPGQRADLLANAVDQGPDVVLDAAFLFVDLFRRHQFAGPHDLRRRRCGQHAKVGQHLRQGPFDTGQVADLGLLRNVTVHLVEEVGVGKVVAGIEGRGGIECVHHHADLPLGTPIRLLAKRLPPGFGVPHPGACGLILVYHNGAQLQHLTFSPGTNGAGEIVLRERGVNHLM